MANGISPDGPTVNPVDRIERTYYCANNHSVTRSFSAGIEESEIPVELECPKCGKQAGLDKDNVPTEVKQERYKTHLAYVKERRTEAEAKELLEEALEKVRERRKRLEDEARDEMKKSNKPKKK